jgi:hypothetical protein
LRDLFERSLKAAATDDSWIAIAATFRPHVSNSVGATFRSRAVERSLKAAPTVYLAK